MALHRKLQQLPFEKEPGRTLLGATQRAGSIQGCSMRVTVLLRGSTLTRTVRHLMGAGTARPMPSPIYSA
eukprot:4803010-Amphidinium_carterae.1